MSIACYSLPFLAKIVMVIVYYLQGSKGAVAIVTRIFDQTLVFVVSHLSVFYIFILLG